MMKYIKDSLALSALVKSKMATDDPNQLETLKEQLKDRFGVPVGVHMTGIPLAVSTLLAIFCYAMLQVSLWLLLFRWLGLPEFKVMMGVFITLTGIMSIIYFIWTGISLLFGPVENYTPQITSLLGLGCFFLNIMWMNSSIFYRSIALTLHNRVWRKQLKIEARPMSHLKR